MVMKAKRLNANAFKKKDLSQYVADAHKKASAFEDDFGGVPMVQEKEYDCLNIAEKKQMGQSRKAYYRVLK